MPSSENCLPADGKTLREALRALVSALNDRDIRYAIIGGVAVIQHARVRTTDDIDVVLTVPQLELPRLFEILRDRGFELDFAKNIREYTDEGFTSIRYGQVQVDLLRPVIPSYAHILDRAITMEILGLEVRVCSAEGLAVAKLMSMRPQDEADIQDLIAAYGSGLDLDFIRAELDSFTESDDSRRSKFEAWVGEATMDA